MESNIKLWGEFQYRILRNFTRLQEKEYRPEFIFKQTAGGYSWPGDWEGRTVLALVLLKDITGAEQMCIRDRICKFWIRDIW